MSDDALVDVRILRLAPGGDAVGPQLGGAADGRTTFVPMAVPGEQVSVRLVREKARVAWAELVSIRHPSSLRVTPPCPLFGRCGGCQWQHVDLGAQRAAKQAIVARALGLSDVPLIAPVETGRGYRDRAHLRVGPEGQIGFRARRSHAVVDVERCLLLAPELEAALGGIRARASLIPADAEIDLQVGREGVVVGLRLPSSVGTAALDGAAMLAAWEPAGVIGVRVSTAGQGRSLTFGVPDVDTAAPAEPALRIPAGAFAQVGRAGNAALLDVVLEAVGRDPGATLELYAGSGNFTRHIVGRATRVVACEADRDAVARGRRLAPQATWLRRPPTAADVDADTILADPPREGLDDENCAAVLRARRRVVYVSCDPQTLARDAAKLGAAGLILRRAVALDLMPHTFHVEVIAVFDRVQENMYTNVHD